jgi:Ca2+-binding EF-hand superfamily protein
MSSITDKFTEQEIRDLKVVYDVYDPGDSGCVETKDIRKVQQSKLIEQKY